MKKKKTFWQQHSLSIIASSILLLWIVLYIPSDETKHWGSFFGNAIADWTGVVAIVISTKFMYERGSSESRKPPSKLEWPYWKRFIEEHSLSLFFILTGIGWVIAFARMSPTSKMGQVVGNILSEWVQIIGTIFLTKRFFEVHSKE